LDTVQLFLALGGTSPQWHRDLADPGHPKHQNELEP
jgi:hypothetical protein